ncbi:MAG: D-Ala-D-Ala carboxypeptidase family metallohydrolase [Neptuniibacter sp.]
MGDLTKNISRHELSCNCGCGFHTMDWETIEVVQDVCDHFAEQLGEEKVTLSIHSAARCYTYNRSPAVGSNDNSQHPKACAIDFHIVGVSLKEIYEYLDQKYPNTFGIGLYKTFVHVDSRSYRARW